MSTRTGYTGNMHYWQDFCDLFCVDYTDLNNHTAADFLGWCWTFTTLNGEQASKVLTSVTSLLSEHDVNNVSIFLDWFLVMKN